MASLTEHIGKAPTWKPNLSSSTLPISFIDCYHRTIVPGSISAQYIALSYVWGDSGATAEESDVQSNWPSPTKLPDICPPVIEDAIVVAKQLECRYLWVDRYCINQTDRDIKHTQILQMDKVYNSASVTIISTVGDVALGLPGVSQARQPLETLRIGEHRLWALPFIETVLKTSPWGSRGWTYQERFFSRRCLIFAEQQVYYENRQGTVANENEHRRYFMPECLPGAQIPYSSQKTFDINQTGTAFLEQIEEDPGALMMYIADGRRHMNDHDFTKKPPGLRAFEHHIYHYGKRALTFKSDALNAISGVLSNLSSGPNGQRSFLGLPVGTMDDTVLANDENKLQTEEGLAYGLCWTHGVAHPVPTLQRTREFPSWTWAGWSGLPPTWLPPYVVDDCPFSTANIEFRDGKDGVMKLGGERKSLRANQYQGPIGRKLCITADTMTFKFERCVGTAGTTGPGAKLSEWKYVVKRDNSASGFLPCPLHLTRAVGPAGEDFEPRLLSEMWDGLILCKSNVLELAYVLVVGKVSPEAEYGERIGVLVVPEEWCLRGVVRKATIIV